MLPTTYTSKYTIYVHENNKHTISIYTNILYQYTGHNACTYIPFLLVMNSNFFAIIVSRLMLTDVSPAALRADARRANTIPFVVMPIELSPGNRDNCSKQINKNNMNMNIHKHIHTTAMHIPHIGKFSYCKFSREIFV